MKRVKSNVKEAFLKNDFFIKILHTSRYLQIALLRLKPGAEISLETHDSMDQFFGFKGGKGKCFVEGKEYTVESGDVILLPAGSRDEVIKYDCHKKVRETNDFFNFNQKNTVRDKTKNVLKRIS